MRISEPSMALASLLHSHHYLMQCRMSGYSARSQHMQSIMHRFGYPGCRQVAGHARHQLQRGQEPHIEHIPSRFPKIELASHRRAN